MTEILAETRARENFFSLPKTERATIANALKRTRKLKAEAEKHRLFEYNHPLAQCWYCWTRWNLESWLPSEPCPNCGSAVKYLVKLINAEFLEETGDAS